MKTVGNFEYSAYVVGQCNMLFYSILADKIKKDLHKGINNLYFQDYIKVAKLKTNKELGKIDERFIVISPKVKKDRWVLQVSYIHAALQEYKPKKGCSMPLYIYERLANTTGLTRLQIRYLICHIKKGRYDKFLNSKYKNN